MEEVYIQRPVKELSRGELIALVEDIHNTLYVKNCPETYDDHNNLEEIHDTMKAYRLAPEPHPLGWHLGARDPRIRDHAQELENLIAWRDMLALDWYGEELVFHILRYLVRPRPNEIPEEHKQAHIVFKQLSDDDQLLLIEAVLRKNGSY